MSEVEEYLLMIYLEEMGFLSKESFLKSSFHVPWWYLFKKEELGRILPESFEFYISQSSYQRMREDKIVCASLDREKDYYSTIKIKITVVE